MKSLLFLASFWVGATVFALDYAMNNMPEEAALVLDGDTLMEWYPEDLALITLPSYKCRRPTRGLQLKPGDVLLSGYSSVLLKTLLFLLNVGLGSWDDAPGYYFGYFVIGEDEKDAEERMKGRRWFLPEPPIVKEYDYGFFPKVEGIVPLFESYGASLARREVYRMNGQKFTEELSEGMPFKDDRAEMLRNAFKSGGSLLDVAKAWSSDPLLSQILKAAVSSIKKESKSLHRTFLGRLYILNIINCPPPSQECLKLAKDFAAILFPADPSQAVDPSVMQVVDWTRMSEVMPVMVHLGFLNFQLLIEQIERDISRVHEEEEANLSERGGEVNISEENFDALLLDMDFEFQEGGAVKMIKQKTKGFTPSMERAQQLITNVVVDRSDQTSGIELFERLADARHGEHELAKYILNYLPAQFHSQIQFAADANFAIQTEATELFDPRTPLQQSSLKEVNFEALMKPTILYKLTRIASTLLEKGSNRDFKKLKVNWDGASSGNVWCHGLESWSVAKDVSEYVFEKVAKRDPNLKCLIWDGLDSLMVKSADSNSVLQLLQLPKLSLLPFKGKVPENHALIISSKNDFAKLIEDMQKEINWEVLSLQDKLSILVLFAKSKGIDVPLIAAN